MAHNGTAGRRSAVPLSRRWVVLELLRFVGRLTARWRWPLVAGALAWVVMAGTVSLGSSADGATDEANAQALAELYSPDEAAAGVTAADSDAPGGLGANGELGPIDKSGSAAPGGGSLAATSVPYVPVRDASLAAQVVSEATVHPVRLVIPDLGIDMPISPVGVQEDGQMAIPDDVDAVGWYEYGSVPGAEQGTTVLASHVDSWTKGAGPFALLRNQATAGTWVNIYLSDGSVRSYSVIDNRMIPKTHLPVDALFNRTSEHRLVLVTCGGRFLHDVGRYTDNIVVTATPAA